MNVKIENVTILKEGESIGDDKHKLEPVGQVKLIATNIDGNYANILLKLNPGNIIVLPVPVLHQLLQVLHNEQILANQQEAMRKSKEDIVLEQFDVSTAIKN